MKKTLFLLFIVIAGFTSSDVHNEFIKLNWDKSALLENPGSGKLLLNFENAEHTRL